MLCEMRLRRFECVEKENDKKIIFFDFYFLSGSDVWEMRGSDVWEIRYFLYGQWWKKIEEKEGSLWSCVCGGKIKWYSFAMSWHMREGGELCVFFLWCEKES